MYFCVPAVNYSSALLRTLCTLLNESSLVGPVTPCSLQTPSEVALMRFTANIDILNNYL